ncbi:MAG: pyridoxamine 5'-phosphate oxidase family protein [Pseudomonadota bacterium]
MVELAAIEQEAWAQLSKVEGAPDHPFRTVSLASIDQQGHPQTRSLILRAADPETKRIILHTDIRSAKWAELQANPKVSLLGYDPTARLQLRFAGQAALFAPGSSEQEDAWLALSDWTKSTYCGGPPGHDVTQGYAPAPRDAPPSEEESAFGQMRFGVIEIRAQVMDWYRHQRGENLRAQFRYDGADSTGVWVNP